MAHIYGWNLASTLSQITRYVIWAQVRLDFINIYEFHDILQLMKYYSRNAVISPYIVLGTIG